jgi:transcriptional regulator with XRE-family HTH domain
LFLVAAALIERLGDNVRTIREATGLSQAAFAQRLGVTANYLWRIENGERRPGLDLLRVIARIGGVTVDQVMEQLPASFHPIVPVLWVAQEDGLELDADLAARLDGIREKLDEISREHALRHPPSK